MRVSSDARQRWLEQIRENIASDGHHVTLVPGSEVPRFAYTIGLAKPLGREVVLAGGSALSNDEAARVLNEAAAWLRRDPETPEVVEIDGVGVFGLRPADGSWVKRLLLGAMDVAATDDVDALQVVPLGELETIDVPDMTASFDTEREPVWRWLDDTWDLNIPRDATAVTNLDALRGHAVTEAARWEPDQWELFSGSGPDTPPEEIRIVPVWTLVGADPSVRAVLDLAVGKALARDWPGDWQTWGA
jgi:hypothetical protein